MPRIKIHHNHTGSSCVNWFAEMNGPYKPIGLVICWSSCIYIYIYIYYYCYNYIQLYTLWEGVQIAVKLHS